MVDEYLTQMSPIPDALIYRLMIKLVCPFSLFISRPKIALRSGGQRGLLCPELRLVHNHLGP